MIKLLLEMGNSLQFKSSFDETLGIPFTKAFEDTEPIKGRITVPIIDKAIEKIEKLKDRGKFWIGITSNGIKGCEKRWNNKYKKEGFGYMTVIYSTTSDNYRKQMEGILICHCREKGYNIQNKIEGGSGKSSSNNSDYVVYFVSEY